MALRAVPLIYIFAARYLPATHWAFAVGAKMLGRFKNLFARTPKATTIGFACALKNATLGLDHFGSAREVADAVRSECGLSLGEAIKHIDSEVSVRPIYQDQPLLEWHGGPKAADLMLVIESIAKGDTQVITEHADVLNPEVSGSYAPLVSAAARGQLEVVSLLVQLGASLDLPGGLGMTALHWACARGHDQVATELVRAGASTDVFNWFRFKPGELAAINGHRRLARRLAPQLSVPGDDRGWIRFAVDRMCGA